MQRKIVWESQHLEIDVLTGKLHHEEEVDDNETNTYIEEYENEDKMQNVMSTPFGFWKVDDTMNPYKQFKMWMGHTNFSITEEVVNTIKQIPGVEVLKILTRYRFIVGVAELFEFSDIRRNVEEYLSCHQDEISLIVDDELKQKVYDLQEKLSSQYNQWAIYVLPNGNYDYTTSDEEEFFPKLNLFKNAVDHSQGILIEGKNE